jgi:hypothetical protein
VVLQHLPGVTEENYEIPVRIADTTFPAISRRLFVADFPSFIPDQFHVSFVMGIILLEQTFSHLFKLSSGVLW